MENIQRQFEKLKADYAESVKREASSQVILDQLKNDLEQTREDKRLQGQIVEQQNLMINRLLQLVRLHAVSLPTHTHTHIYIDIILHALIVTCDFFNIHMHT
jgi:hypothetical protein